MSKILFIRKFKNPSGGQIKVKDYFTHCLRHSEIDPYLYFTPDSDWASNSFWQLAPRGRIVFDVNLKEYDAVFLGGRDWDYLPEIPGALPVINYIQHVKHADPDDKRFQYLRRPAWRICVSQEVAAAIAPHTNGEICVIDNGISLELFNANASKIENSILIWARKNPVLGGKIFAALHKKKYRVRLLNDYLPREEFARCLQESDVFVALPHETEGFYLPALEAMACGCAVICSDAVGNRSFCLSEETCLMPAFDAPDEHLSMIARLLEQPVLKHAVRQRGLAKAKTFTLDAERQAFDHLLAKIFRH